MSGYKRATVSISQDEYDRLRGAELKLRSLPETSGQDYNALIKKSTSVLQDNLVRTQKRQEILENLLSGMGDYVRDLESTTAQRMIDFQHKAVAEAQNYAGCLWDHYDRVISQQAEYFETTIAATHQLYQNELTQYTRRVRIMAEDQEQKRQMAVEWLTAAEQLDDFIQQNYDHERFTPERVERLERQLQQAGQNLDIGLSEAVILTAQQLYSAFSDLRVDLERLIHEWSLLLQTAWEAVSQVLLTAQESLVVPAVDLDGNPLAFDVQVDYWTQGRLSQLIDDLTFIKSRLESGEDLPNSETLQHWLEFDLPVYVHALEDIVLDARVCALNSQLRINIADLVVRALQDQGFALETCNYEAADQRMSYGARLINLEGSEVVVQVAPTGNDLGQNELHLQSSDREERTEHEMVQRWNEVSRSLSFYGLDVGQLTREDSPVYQTSGNNPRLRTGQGVRNRQQRSKSVQENGH